MRPLNLIVTLGTSLIISACATSGNSIRDVPKINSEKIQVPAMSALPKRTLSLVIVDSRRPELREQSQELRSEIERSTQQAVTRAGIQVLPSSPNVLTLTVQDHQTQKFQEGCVKITGSLLIPQKAKLGSEASSCYEMKNFLGGRMSSDITTAYEEALSLVFKNLDEALGKLQTL